MKPTRRTLLSARAIAILLLGMGASAIAHVFVRAVGAIGFDPGVPVGFWPKGPAVVAAAGTLILLRTRWCLRHLPGWVLR